MSSFLRRMRRRRSGGTDRRAEARGGHPDPPGGTGDPPEGGTVYRPPHPRACTCADCAGARTLGLRVEQDTVPILATRVARWRAVEGTPFGAINENYGWFGVEDRARCRAVGGLHRVRRGNHHPGVPDPMCTCGFYSVVSDEHAFPNRYSHVRLDVMLAGRIVVHDRGFRAQWQRVLGVRVPPCECGRRRDRLVLGPDRQLRSMHSACVEQQMSRLYDFELLHRVGLLHRVVLDPRVGRELDPERVGETLGVGIGIQLEGEG